jgi:molybdate transport system substrate-binding protein
MQLHLLSGGAAAAVVEAVQPAFEVETGCKITGTYSAVGEMRDQLLKGQPCDLIILTGPLIDGLIASGHVLASSARSLGRVKTGIAVKSGTTHPAIATPEDLLKLLSRAQGIFFPDPVKATAGIHFMSVLKTLKLDVFKQAAFRPFPNGATAMRALAACSQPDLDYVGNLPLAFELATNYTLGLCSGVEHPQLAQLLADWLAGPLTAEIRHAGGFEF